MSPLDNNTVGSIMHRLASASSSPSPTTVVIAGGIPDRTDEILSGIFIVFFLLIGVYFHFRVFHAYGKKFIWNGLCFSYCMARVVALSLRIAVVHNPGSKVLNIIAQVLIAAGVALLYVVNLQMARRFFGQLHPHHSVLVKRFVTSTIVVIIPVLAMVIVTVVQSYTTHDSKILTVDRDIRLAASTIFVFLPFVPIPIVCTILYLKFFRPTVATTFVVSDGPTNSTPTLDVEKKDQLNVTLQSAKTSTELEHGSKSLYDNADTTVIADVENNTVRQRVKGEPMSGFGPVPISLKEILETAAVILVPAILLTFEQGVRCAQAFYVYKSGEAIPWHMSKATFWICIFGLEIVSVLTFGLAMLPRRFSHLQLV